MINKFGNSVVPVVVEDVVVVVELLVEVEVEVVVEEEVVITGSIVVVVVVVVVVVILHPKLLSANCPTIEDSYPSLTKEMKEIDLRVSGKEVRLMNNPPKRALTAYQATKTTVVNCFDLGSMERTAQARPSVQKEMVPRTTIRCWRRVRESKGSMM